MIEVECKDRADKEKIIEKKYKLKGSDCFIDHDLTFKERRNKEKIWNLAREYKEKGKSVKIGYNKLVIDNEEYKWDKWREKIFRKKTRRKGGHRKQGLEGR